MKGLACFNPAVLFLVAVVSCSESLPRAKELPCDVSGFHQVFTDVESAKPCDELHSLMVLKDGEVIFEEYAPGHDKDEMHVMWSASKSVTALAVGFAWQEGLLDVNDPIVKYFTPEELPSEPSETLKKVTIHDLLTMSAGFCEDPVGRGMSGEDFDWVKYTLALDFIFEPGTRFCYNSFETYLLSVIVSKLSGQTIEEYLEPRLFKPLGIKDHYWKTSPQGYNCGGWGLYINLESFAKIGQFFLQRGEWKGKRLLDAKWFDQAMSPQIMQYAGSEPDEATLESFKTNDWAQGYGYQMWCCTHGAYRLDGAYGQMCLICPEKNCVIAYFAYCNETARLVNSCWKNIYDVLP